MERVCHLIRWDRVEDEEQTYPVKTVLTVPSSSMDLDLDESGASQGRRAKQREMLIDLSKSLKDRIPSFGMTLASVARFLNGQIGLSDTADVYGPARKSRFVKVLKLYPMF